MTQEDEKKVEELNTIFLALNDKEQKTALAVLQSLAFAQSVLCSQVMEQPHTPPKQTA